MYRKSYHVLNFELMKVGLHVQLISKRSENGYPSEADTKQHIDLVCLDKNGNYLKTEHIPETR